MERDLCIYHANCADGFASAWIVRRFHEAINKEIQLDLYAAKYNEPPPDVQGYGTVWIVDFSYPEDIIRDLASQVGQLAVFDHHDTAEAQLKNLIDETTDIDYQGNINIIFDMEKSGAGICWKYLFPKAPLPILIMHIQDRDLWNFNNIDTKAFMEYLFSFPYDFDVWAAIERKAVESTFYEDMILEGEALLRKKRKDCLEIVQSGRHMLIINSIRVPAVNCPYQLASDIGEILCQGTSSFSATYFLSLNAGGEMIANISLRSDKHVADSTNVGIIARQFNGGGHEHASGFKIGLPLFTKLFNWPKPNSPNHDNHAIDRRVFDG